MIAEEVVQLVFKLKIGMKQQQPLLTKNAVLMGILIIQPAMEVVIYLAIPLVAMMQTGYLLMLEIVEDIHVLISQIVNLII